MVTKEIVDYVGHWEEIVDVPVLLRSLDTELGDLVLQVLEQIVEVLKVIPERIASQLKGWSCDERISERLGEQTVTSRRVIRGRLISTGLFGSRWFSRVCSQVPVHGVGS